MKKLAIRLLAMMTLAVIAAPVDTESSGYGITDEYFNIVGEADSAIAAGEWERAEEALIRAMNLYPSNPGNIMLMSNLGIVRLNMGHDSLALATLDEAHAMAPQSVTVLQNRARVFTVMGRIDDACKDYSRAVELDSTAVYPRFYRMMIGLRNSVNIRDVLTDMEALERIAPEASETILARAMLASATGNYAEAVKAWTKVIRNDPQPEYYGERALANLMTDRLGDAADDIASGLAVDPDDPTLYLYRAMLAKARYRPEDARADMETAIRLGADRTIAEELLR